MKNFMVIFLAALLTILFSCKKDKVIDNIPPETTYPDFAKLKVGNYWVYQLFDVDTAGIGTPENKFDSCYIEKDTVINCKTYFKFYRKSSSAIQLHNFFVRDSLHYVVDNYGSILFSSQDFSSILRINYTCMPGDTISKNTFKMDEKNVVVSTPYGPFTTYD
jgi:hypothetical protein